MRWFIACLTLVAILGWIGTAVHLKKYVLYSLQAARYAELAATLKAQAEHNKGRSYQLTPVETGEPREGFQTNNGLAFKEYLVTSEVDAKFI